MIGPLLVAVVFPDTRAPPEAQRMAVFLSSRGPPKIGSTLRNASSEMWQAMEWPSLACRRGGGSLSQTAPSLRGQRPAKRQPLGRSTGLGASPSRRIRFCWRDRKSTRLNSSHPSISYAVFCLKKKNNTNYDFLLLKKKKKK